MNKDPKVIVAIAVVAILVIAGIAVAVVAINNNNNNTTKHTNVEDMTFDEMVEAAKGTSVNIGFYADTYCTLWLDTVFAPYALDKYNITVTHSYTGTEFQETLDAYKNGTNSAYDIVWGRASGVSTWLNIDDKGTSLLLQSNYQDKMPNVKNYSDGRADNTWKVTYEAAYGEGTYSKDVCSVTPFSGSVTTFVFNKNYNDNTVDWDKVKFVKTVKTKVLENEKEVVKTEVVTKNVKVAVSGDTLDITKDVSEIDESPIYSIESVQDYRNANIGTTGSTAKVGDTQTIITGHYGLPNNYTELASWIQIYPEQFYIPSVTSGYVNFHTQLILEAMIFELASNGDSWIACTDKDADVWDTDGALAGKWTGNAETDKATYVAYMETKIGACTSGEDYAKAAPYLAKYIESLQPYLNKTYTDWDNYNTTANNTLIGNVTGKNTDEFSKNTIMIALSTTESLAYRAGSYKASINMYMMETACANRCGMFIPSNASNPAGAIVICDLLNDPTMQSQYYNLSGNGYNVDLDKISALEKSNFEALFAQYKASGAAWIEPTVIKENSIPASIGCKEDQLATYIDPYIKSTVS